MKDILIIDDQFDLTEMLEEHLSDEGYKTQGCCYARDAVDIISKKRFDLIICDVSMPHTDGLQIIDLVKKIHSQPPGFVYITGAKDYTEEFLLDSGASVVFKKPVDFDQLSHWVDGYFANNRP